MWAQAATATPAQWDEALGHEEQHDAGVIAATGNVLCAVRKFHEIFVGGDETSCLVQVLAGHAEEGENNGEMDVIASVLIPAEEVAIVYTARGLDASRLVCSFWSWSPGSPALLQHAGTYHRLMCMVPEAPWTQGVLCPAHVRALQTSSGTAAAETLHIYVPGEEVASGRTEEEKRAAVSRPRGLSALADSPDTRGIPQA